MGFITRKINLKLLSNHVAHLCGWDGTKNRSILCNPSGHLSTAETFGTPRIIGPYVHHVVLGAAALSWSPWINCNYCQGIVLLIINTGANPIQSFEMEISGFSAGAGPTFRMANKPFLLAAGSTHYIRAWDGAWNVYDDESIHPVMNSFRIGATSVVGSTMSINFMQLRKG